MPVLRPRRPAAAHGLLSPRIIRPTVRDPRFVLLLAAQTVNSVGGWASAIALWGFAAYRALVLGYLAAAGAAISLASAGSLVSLDAAAVGYGVTRALTGPAAAAALPPRIVAGEDLLAANSLLGVAGPAGQILGPWWPAPPLPPPGSGLCSCWTRPAIWSVPGPSPCWRAGRCPCSRADRNPGLQGGRRGHVHLRRLPRRRAAVRRPCARPPAQFALFEAVAGVGAVLASLVMPRFGARSSAPGRPRLASVRVVALGACGYGLSAVVFTGTTWVPVAYVGAFAWGISGAVFAVALIITLQQRVPVGEHGRVLGLAAALQSAAEAIGLPAAGIALALLGIRAGAAALAGVAVAAGVTTLTLGGRAPAVTADR